MTGIIPKEISSKELYSLIIGAIAPRPIAFASTIDMKGTPNVAPFSFFNFFGSNPPTIIFSTSRKGTNNTNKDTFNNLKAIPEVVINMVNYSMVNQVCLASIEFAPNVDEFAKAGFTPLKSDCVKPFRVKESPVQIECTVRQIIETGQQGGAGNLIICNIEKVHISENILDNTGNIDPHKADLVGRMGKDYYCRASGSAIFEVKKPGSPIAMGIDALPDYIRFSNTLTGNDLARIGSLSALPDPDLIGQAKTLPEFKKLLEDHPIPDKTQREAIHKLAQRFIQTGNISTALAICMDNN